MKRILRIVGLVALFGLLVAGTQLRAAPGDAWLCMGTTPFPDGNGFVAVFSADGVLTPTPTRTPTSVPTSTPTLTRTPTVTPTPTYGGMWQIECPDAPFVQIVPGTGGRVSIMIECH